MTLGACEALITAMTVHPTLHRLQHTITRILYCLLHQDVVDGNAATGACARTGACGGCAALVAAMCSSCGGCDFCQLTAMDLIVGLSPHRPNAERLINADVAPAICRCLKVEATR